MKAMKLSSFVLGVAFLWVAEGVFNARGVETTVAGQKDFDAVALERVSDFLDARVNDKRYPFAQLKVWKDGSLIYNYSTKADWPDCATTAKDSVKTDELDSVKQSACNLILDEQACNLDSTNNCGWEGDSPKAQAQSAPLGGWNGNVDDDSIFRVYSMTKIITAAAGMIALEDGDIRLTDPVSKYLKKWEDTFPNLFPSGRLLTTEADYLDRENSVGYVASEWGTAYIPDPMPAPNGPTMMPFFWKKNPTPATILDLFRHSAGVSYSGLFGDIIGPVLYDTHVKLERWATFPQATTGGLTLFTKPSEARNPTCKPTSIPNHVPLSDADCTARITGNNDATPSSCEQADNKCEFDYNFDGLVGIANNLGSVPRAYVPGTKSRYSLSPLVLGAVIEVANSAGQTFKEFVKTRIFEPLEMTSAGWDDASIDMTKLLPMYRWSGGKPESTFHGGEPGVPFNYTTSSTMYGDSLLGHPSITKAYDWTYDPLAAESNTPLPDGGSLMTLDDYGKFMNAILFHGLNKNNGQRMYSQQSGKLMYRNTIPMNKEMMGWNSFFGKDGIGFSLGGQVGLEWAKNVYPSKMSTQLGREEGASIVYSEGHMGWAGYADTFTRVDFARKLVYVFGTQVQVGHNNPAKLNGKNQRKTNGGKGYERLIYAALKEPNTQTPQTIPVASKSALEAKLIAFLDSAVSSSADTCVSADNSSNDAACAFRIAAVGTGEAECVPGTCSDATYTTKSECEGGAPAGTWTLTSEMCMFTAGDGKGLPHARVIAYQDGQKILDVKNSVAGRETTTDESLYRMYSMSKIVTTVALMKLYELDLVDLSAPASYYLGTSWEGARVLNDDATAFEYKNDLTTDKSATTTAATRDVMVRDLLMHTAGVGYGDIFSDIYGEYFHHEQDTIYMDNGIRHIRSNYDNYDYMTDFCDVLGSAPLMYSPGTAWGYSLGLDVVACIVSQIVSNADNAGILGDTFIGFPDFVKKEIFDKAGLSADAGYSVTNANKANLLGQWRRSATDSYVGTNPNNIRLDNKWDMFVTPAHCETLCGSTLCEESCEPSGAQGASTSYQDCAARMMFNGKNHIQCLNGDDGECVYNAFVQPWDDTCNSNDETACSQTSGCAWKDRELGEAVLGTYPGLTLPVHGGGGMIGQAEDYMKFGSILENRGVAINGNRILSSATVDLMTANGLVFAGGEEKSIAELSANCGTGVCLLLAKANYKHVGHGLGGIVYLDGYQEQMGTMARSPGTYGWVGLAGTRWLYDPVKKLSYGFFTQLTSGTTQSGVDRQKVEEYIYHALVDNTDFAPGGTRNSADGSWDLSTARARLEMKTSDLSAATVSAAADMEVCEAGAQVAKDNTLKAESECDDIKAEIAAMKNVSANEIVVPGQMTQTTSGVATVRAWLVALGAVMAACYLN